MKEGKKEGKKKESKQARKPLLAYPSSANPEDLLRRSRKEHGQPLAGKPCNSFEGSTIQHHVAMSKGWAP